MSLRATNLNLLPVLLALLKEVSITRAGASVGLSQPATSNALNRLREVFADPLLVKVGRKMQLTPRARELLPLVEKLCADIEIVLDDLPFDPAVARRTFTIATPDYIALLLGPHLINVLSLHAPDIQVRFTDVPQEFREKMVSGGIDVAIIAWTEEFAKGFCYDRGYRDRMVGVVGKDHPFALQPPISPAQLALYPMIAIDPGYRVPHEIRRLADVTDNVRSVLSLGASQLVALPLLAARTESTVLVPQALATYISGLVPIATFDWPGEEFVIDATLLWSKRNDADPAHRWFRGILADAMRDHFH